MHKKHIFIPAFLVIVIGVLVAWNGSALQPAVPAATTTPSIDTSATLPAVSSPTSTQARQTQVLRAHTAPKGTATNTSATLPAPNVTFSVTGSSYTAFAPAGSTVIDAMRILASTTGFFFSGKDYPSLGFFVDSINGKKAESGHNWILYVNGKLSATGASQTTLETGDTVEWRYEKNY